MYQKTNFYCCHVEIVMCVASNAFLPHKITKHIYIVIWAGKAQKADI